jgi:hypothetical protein
MDRIGTNYRVGCAPRTRTTDYHVGVFTNLARRHRLYHLRPRLTPTRILTLDVRRTAMTECNSGLWLQPITFARSLDSSAWLERRGPNDDGNVHLTLYNPSDTEARPTHELETNQLGSREPGSAQPISSRPALGTRRLRRGMRRWRYPFRYDKSECCGWNRTRGRLRPAACHALACVGMLKVAEQPGTSLRKPARPTPGPCLQATETTY